MEYVSALVAYDGSAYHGFQYQANAASIQCELEAALDRVAERVGRVAGAGAFRSMGLDRRQALWQVAALADRPNGM